MELRPKHYRQAVKRTLDHIGWIGVRNKKEFMSVYEENVRNEKADLKLEQELREMKNR